MAGAMMSSEPSQSISCGCAGCAPPISSIIEPSAKTSPAVVIGDGVIVAEWPSGCDIGCSSKFSLLPVFYWAFACKPPYGGCTTFNANKNHDHAAPDAQSILPSRFKLLQHPGFSHLSVPAFDTLSTFPNSESVSFLCFSPTQQALKHAYPQIRRHHTGLGVIQTIDEGDHEKFSPNLVRDLLEYKRIELLYPPDSLPTHDSNWHATLAQTFFESLQPYFRKFHSHNTIFFRKSNNEQCMPVSLCHCVKFLDQFR